MGMMLGGPWGALAGAGIGALASGIAGALTAKHSPSPLEDAIVSSLGRIGGDLRKPVHQSANISQTVRFDIPVREHIDVGTIAPYLDDWGRRQAAEVWRR